MTLRIFAPFDLRDPFGVAWYLGVAGKGIGLVQVGKQKKKEGFSIPIKHWLRQELRELMLDHLTESRIREGGFFNPAPVRKMIDAHLAGRKNFSHQLWALLVFEIWRENYL